MTIRITRNRAHEVDKILKSISYDDYEFKRKNLWNYGRKILLEYDVGIILHVMFVG
jgi:hypothetical protein